MRKSLVVAVTAAVGSVALLAGQAGAVSVSSLQPAVALNVSGLNGTCVPEFVAAGVGSTGGLQYKVQGVGTSSVDTPATQVECKFHDTDTGADIAIFKSGFKPGPAADLAVDYTVHTLDNFITCVRVDSIDPTTGVTRSTPWMTSGSQRCA
jgi:hypothetical protein